MAKGPGVILAAIGAWVALVLMLIGFAAFMTLALTCAPWTVAWRNYAGPEAAPACPLTHDPWAHTPTASH